MPEPAKNFDLVEAIEGLRRQGETATAVVSVSTIEDWLTHAIKANMRVLPTKIEQRIFDGYGPLSTFAAKIDIAYAFKLIEKDVLDDLRALKDIRNAFAHSREPLHFKSSSLQSLFQRLKGWRKEVDPETLFMERANACVEPLRKVLDFAALIKALQEHKTKQPASE